MAKDKKLEIRCTQQEKNYWKMKAGVYFKGNLTDFIRYCLNNYTLAGFKKGDETNAEYIERLLHGDVQNGHGE